jgi:hypothetical protein
MRHVKQILEFNQGIQDIVGDDSVSHKGFKYHSSFDFTQDKLGLFCNVIKELEVRSNAGTVIELGCGSAVIATCLKPETNYLGLDGNPDSGLFIDRLAQENKSNIVLDFTKEFVLEPAPKADLLLSFDFFEHLPNDKLDFAVEKAGGLLNEGGLAFFIIDRLPLAEHISIYPLEFWREKFERINGWTWIEDGEFMDFFFSNPCDHWNQNKEWHNYLMYRG